MVDEEDLVLYWKYKVVLDEKRNKWMKVQNILLFGTLLCSIVTLLLVIL